MEQSRARGSALAASRIAILREGALGALRLARILLRRLQLHPGGITVYGIEQLRIERMAMPVVANLHGIAIGSGELPVAIDVLDRPDRAVVRDIHVRMLQVLVVVVTSVSIGQMERFVGLCAQSLA